MRFLASIGWWIIGFLPIWFTGTLASSIIYLEFSPPWVWQQQSRAFAVFMAMLLGVLASSLFNIFYMEKKQ